MNDVKTIGQYFMSTKVLYFAQLSALIILLVIAVVVQYLSLIELNIGFLSDTVKIIALVFLIAAVLGSQVIYRAGLKNLRNSNDLKSLLIKYRTLQIIRFSMVEGPALFAAIGYMFTGSSLFIVFVLASLLVLLTIKPSRFKLIEDLQLNTEQQDMLSKPDAVIPE
jgi:hypothetical protein